MTQSTEHRWPPARMVSAIVVLAVAAGSAVVRAEEKTAGSLDSRTVPHPEWVQVSGQIQHTATVKREGGAEHVIARLRLPEGGQVMVDLGPAQNVASVSLDQQDYVHVRGLPVQTGEEVTIQAGELYADGKVIHIQQPEPSLPGLGSGMARQKDEPPLSPAAPRP
ncbi:MAG TPA: hypothetical protein VFS39_06075 [Nitrospira sp.]|nr:hypothetical protein [Nitrospira sp.]